MTQPLGPAAKSVETIAAATASYETWLGARIPLVREDLARKHERMARDPFQFFRATHYRWVQRLSALEADWSQALCVLAVGDLHVENFGTWRDREGRLVWGVNDFDESALLPYTHDLVRLATSVLLAGEVHGGRFKRHGLVATLLEGYRASLEAGGCPCVLAEAWCELGRLATARETSPPMFWEKLRGLPAAGRRIPGKARRLLLAALPDVDDVEILKRVAGLGSLGHERYVGLGTWSGGLVAREVKRLPPPSIAWARDLEDERSRGSRLLDKAIRCADPMSRVKGQWVVRRLAPDSTKIELADLSAQADVEALIFAMGWETANIHLGSTDARTLRRDLRTRHSRWLVQAALSMCSTVVADWQSWQRTREAAGDARHG